MILIVWSLCCYVGDKFGMVLSIIVFILMRISIIRVKLKILFSVLNLCVLLWGVSIL